MILITRNQAWNVDRLVGSVLRETARLPAAEVVLVDSDSIDGTAEAAALHPIGVLRLHADQKLTAAAGRYVGYRQTTGSLVLFLDGDMELCPGWLEQAIRTMEQHSDVAVLAGRIIDLLPTAIAEDERPLLRTDDATSRDIPYSGGAAMHRRAVLEEVGPFNPYLSSDEEPELCIRIRQAGYRVQELDRAIAFHYSEPAGALSTLVGRWRRGLFLGAGQAIRYHLGDGLLWPYVRERGYGIVPGVGVVAGLATFFDSRRTGRSTWLASWCGSLLVLVSVDAYRKQSLHRTLHSLLQRVFILDGTFRGFLARPLDPDGYPARFDTVSEKG